MSFAQLRPLSFGELLDGAFTLYRRHFASLVLTALVPLLANVVLWLALAAGIGSTDSDTATGIYFVGVAGSWPLMMLTSGLASCALAYFIGRAYTGNPVTPRQALAAAGSRFFGIVGAVIVTAVLVVIGILLCFVPGLFVAAACFAVFPVLMLERRGPIEAITRSYDLAKNAWGEVFLVLLVIYLIAAMPGMAVGGAGVVANVLAAGDATRSLEVQALMQVVTTLVSALTTPFSIAGVVLLYYDRRVRTEALDVQMMAEALGGPGAPESPAGPGYGQPYPGQPYGGPPPSGEPPYPGPERPAPGWG
jgi:hypothetical protein